jgi:hypothetical protein
LDLLLCDPGSGLGVWGQDPHRPPVQKGAIVSAIDAEGPGEVSGAPGEAVFGPAVRPAVSHGFDANQRFESADEDRFGDIRPGRDDIQAVVQPVDEVDVGAAPRLEHRGVAWRPPSAGRVRRAIFGADVCLDFHDPSGRLSPAHAALDDEAE